MKQPILRVTATKGNARGFSLRGRSVFGGAGLLRAGLFAGLVGLTLGLSAPAGQASGTVEDRFLQLKKPIAAPGGFRSVCGTYVWACLGGGATGVDEGDILSLAQSVNRRVNSGFRQVSDAQQYGVREVWALPTGRGGDCEDFVLLKKLALIKKGVPASRLLIATVLDRKREPHAVLVLRMQDGDLVLDNLRSQIKPWNRTGYTFLRVQDPASPAHWQAVFAGGIFRDL